MKPQIIIGCGMPRSGTGSLAKLINDCKNATIGHETQTHLSFEFNKEKLKEKLWVIDKMKGKYVGDVGHYYLNYLDYLIRFKKVKVVCIQREKGKVIESMKTLGWNVYQDSTRDKLFPFPQINKKFEIAASIHYDLYNRKIRQLKRKFPYNILIIKTEDLNNREGVHKIFNFLKIDREDRNYQIGIREHKNLGL